VIQVLSMGKEAKKIIAVNKNAFRSYIFIEKIEAGIQLQGTEVKSIRAGKISLKGNYAYVRNNEIFVKNIHIRPYEYGNVHNHDPLRERKILLHRREINKLAGKINERGLTLVVIRVYLSGGKVKLELALSKGKTSRDKRDDIKKREAKIDISRAMKQKY